jgi:cell wall-associated NlpC family hydrolase
VTVRFAPDHVVVAHRSARSDDARLELGEADRQLHGLTIVLLFLTPASRRARRRRMLGGAVVATAAVLTLTAAPSDAAPLAPQSVAGNSHSPAVALLAADALSARDVFAWTGDPVAFTGYLDRLHATADAVAMEYATDPAAVRDAFDRADFAHQTAVLAALSQLGVAYRYASSQPGVAFDCSGLTAFAWERAGVGLPHQSGAQVRAVPNVDPAAATAGDLVQRPGHVMLYLGFGDAIVHAANRASDVELSHARGRSFSWANPIG